MIFEENPRLFALGYDTRRAMSGGIFIGVLSIGSELQFFGGRIGREGNNFLLAGCRHV